MTPRGDTSDFAYAVHTRIAIKPCLQSRRHSRPTLDPPENGQSVEVITAEGQRPQVTWVDIAATGRAKAAIRKSLREEDRERFVKLGRELVRTAFDAIGKQATSKVLRMAANSLGADTPDDVLARVGSSDLLAREVVAAVYPDLSPAEGKEVEPTRAVIGVDADQSAQRAHCCQPVPGERIVGITDKGRGVVIHAIDCANMALYEDQMHRWVDLRWQEGRHPVNNTVSVDLTISNDAGVLGRICTLIGEQSANISDLRFVDRKPDFYRLIVDIDLRDPEHLLAVMTVLEADSNVAEVVGTATPRGWQP